MNNKKKQGIHGIKWNAIGNWGSLLVNFAVFTALARFLNPKDFGLVALVSIYIAFVTLFVTQGFSMAIIQRKDLEQGHLDTAFWMGIVSSVVFMAGSLAASGPIAGFLGDKALQPFIAVLSLTFLFSAIITVQTAIMVREMRFNHLAIRQLAGVVCGGLTGIIMAWAGCGAWSLVGQTTVNSFVNMLTTWRVSGFKPGFKVSWKHLKDLWGYSWAVIANNFMTFFANRTDQFFIGRAINPSTLGLYTVGQKITTMLVAGITSPVEMVSISMLSKVQDDKNKIPGILYRGLEMASLICYPLFFGLICLSKDVIVLVFGQKWAAAGSILAIFACAEIVKLIAMFDLSCFMSFGKPIYNVWILIVKTLGTGVATLIGIRWGVMGIAIGVAVNIAVNTVLSIIFLKRIIPISAFKMVFSARIPVLCSAIMSGAVLAAYRFLPPGFHTLARTLICAAIGAAVYIASVRLISKRVFLEAVEYISILLKRKKSDETAAGGPAPAGSAPQDDPR